MHANKLDDTLRLYKWKEDESILSYDKYIHFDRFKNTLTAKNDALNLFILLTKVYI